jgi:hypothetical protein
LIELFAYFTEMVLYRMNRVTAANRGKFLKLLAPGTLPSDDPAVLAEQIRSAVLGVRGRFRAVTPSDFEHLAIEDFNDVRPATVPAALRARCMPARNLDRGSEVERARPAPGHVSLVIVPGRPTGSSTGVPQPSQPLIDALFAFLDERRTLTTRHHVVGPTVAPVSADIVLARTSDAFDADVRKRVVDRLAAFFDPLPHVDIDGRSLEGWPFGRDVFVSELHEQLEAVPGVDFVTDIALSSTCTGAVLRCVPGVPLYHAEGDQVGLVLAEDRLPLASIDPVRIVIAPSPSFVPVQVALRVTNTAADAVADLKRQVKELVRRFFHPLYDGPRQNATSGVDLTRAALSAVLAPVLSQITNLTLEVDTSHRLPAGATATGTTGVRVRPGEVINWRVRFFEGA